MGLIDFELTGQKGRKHVVHITGWLSELIHSKSGILRFAFSFCFVITAIVLIVCGLFLFAKSINPEKPTHVNDQGAVVFNLNQKEVYLWLFNTSHLFSNSGIRVRKGDRIKITCSGKYQSSINHLVKAAQSDNKPIYHWLDKNGAENKASTSILPSESFASVLVGVFPEGTNPMREPSVAGESYLYEENLRNVSLVTKFSSKTRVKKNGVLYFVVNDIPMNDRYFDADKGLGEQSITEGNEKLKRHDPELSTDRYESLETNYKKSHYNTPFFDDNLGEYLVVVEKSSRFGLSTIFWIALVIFTMLGIVAVINYSLEKVSD